jgi:hypothetical protein
VTFAGWQRNPALNFSLSTRSVRGSVDPGGTQLSRGRCRGLYGKGARVEPQPGYPLPPAQITVCGQFGRDTLAALVELAMQAGAALLVQPRQLPVPVARAVRQITAGEVVTRGRRKKKGRKAQGRPRAAAPRRRSKPRAAAAKPVPPVADLQAPSERRPQDRRVRDDALSLDKSAAVARRWAILQALERAGDAGLSFTALCARVQAHLVDAGDTNQQHVALRNAVYTLRGHGFVERAVGQWVLTAAGRQRVQLGRDGGRL